MDGMAVLAMVGRIAGGSGGMLERRLDQRDRRVAVMTSSSDMRGDNQSLKRLFLFVNVALFESAVGSFAIS